MKCRKSRKSLNHAAWWWVVVVLQLVSPSMTAHAAEPYPGWTAGGAVPLGVEIGPLGATLDYEATPAGTADVFGNGPYDLFLSNRKLLAFRRFLPDGTPVYAPPRDCELPSGSAVLLTDSNNNLYTVYPHGKSVRTASFDRNGMTFKTDASADEALPDGARSFAATLSPGGRLLLFYSVPDGAAYNPTDVHLHSAEFQPFNGAGIWRGGLPYSGLGSAVFADGLKLGKSMFKYPQFGEGRDFQFGNPGISIVNFGQGRERDVVASDKHGTFHYYHNRAADAINLDPHTFISDARGNALRHPGIAPVPAAIPDPDSGMSNLLVGDTGLLWFYQFTGEMRDGKPIFNPPRRVMIEQPTLVLSALPVITSGDVDGDGLIDLVAGNDVGDIYFIRNVGSATEPRFDVPQSIVTGGEVFKINAGYATIQGPGEAQWGYTCPTVYDWNGDGAPDIIFNSIRADVTVLLQVPGSSPPAFEKPVIFKCDSLELHPVWRTQPAVTNWGKDGGRPCIVVNDEQNVLRRFWRIDDYNVERGEVLRLTTGEPIQTHSKRFSGQFGRTKIQVVDWDGDGVLDLLCGTGRSASIPGPGGYPDDTFKGDERQASVLFLRNAGTNDDPVFEYPRLVCFNGKKIALGAHSCSPLAVDLGRGQLDLLVGMEQGVVMYYPREAVTWPDKYNATGGE